MISPRNSSEHVRSIDDPGIWGSRGRFDEFGFAIRCGLDHRLIDFGFGVGIRYDGCIDGCGIEWLVDIGSRIGVGVEFKA